VQKKPAVDTGGAELSPIDFWLSVVVVRQPAALVLVAYYAFSICILFKYYKKPNESRTTPSIMCMMLDYDIYDKHFCVMIK